MKIRWICSRRNGRHKTPYPKQMDASLSRGATSKRKKKLGTVRQTQKGSLTEFPKIRRSGYYVSIRSPERKGKRFIEAIIDQDNKTGTLGLDWEYAFLDEYTNRMPIVSKGNLSLCADFWIWIPASKTDHFFRDADWQDISNSSSQSLMWWQWKDFYVPAQRLYEIFQRTRGNANRVGWIWPMQQ